MTPSQTVQAASSSPVTSPVGHLYISEPCGRPAEPSVHMAMPSSTTLLSRFMRKVLVIVAEVPVGVKIDLGAAFCLAVDGELDRARGLGGRRDRRRTDCY